MHKQSLAQLPTPIQKLKLPSLQTTKSIYIKRDDYTGTEVSGNKIRKLEYCLQEAIDQGCDTIITTGAIQSNHCRATAAACARLGLNCQLVLAGEVKELEGNFFLNQLFGAEIHILEADQERDQYMQDLTAKVAQRGQKAYLIPVGASNAVGSLGYLECYEEILEQEKAMQITFDTIVLTVGSGGTYAGLWYGDYREQLKKTILGYSVSKSAAEFTADIQAILAEMDPEIQDFDSITINDEFVGEGYARYTLDELRFYQQIAQETGIVFDPCYTGKAFRGLYENIEAIPGENILFIHTGGLQGWTQEMREMLIAGK